MSLKFCNKCGGKLGKDEDFCPFCGENLIERKSIEKKIAPSVGVAAVSTKVPAPKPEEEKKPEKKKIDSDQYADFFPRFFAFLIDLVVIFAHCLVAAIFLGNILGGIFFITVVPLIVFFYFFVLEVVNSGQTIGKMALSLKTVDAETLDVASASQYLLNNLLKPLFFIIDLILGLLVNATRGDPKKRFRIMQNASNTCVIVK